MGLKTIQFRDIEHQASNMYEAVVSMYGQAKEELNESELDLVVSGTKSGVLMVESEAKELSEEIMLGAVQFGHKESQCVIDKIIELAEKSAKDSWEVKSKDKPSFHSDLETLAKKTQKARFNIQNYNWGRVAQINFEFAKTTF